MWGSIHPRHNEYRTRPLYHVWHCAPPEQIIIDRDKAGQARALVKSAAVSSEWREPRTIPL